MSDVNARIGVQIDTSQALAELKSLQRQLALFHTSVSKGSASAAAQQRNMQQNLLNSINATGKFSAQMGVIQTSTESFTSALEKNKLSMREYFRFAGGSTKTFGRLFKAEFDTIGKVAQDRVRRLQTQYIKLGRDASGSMKAISVTPTSVNMKDFGTQVAVAAQKQALFNQLLKQGSTNLLNFGKNTQWAGRQLMVGFTIPLAYLGTAAAKTFMDLEAQAVRFKRVYGDIFTTTEQTNEALENVRQLAESFTKYGIAVVDTMKMAADAAAMGKTGADLTAQVAQATRLAVLGGVEQGQALETTISITNAFGTAAEDLAKKINFLNAVENQTVVSIEDLTIAIPKAGPVVKQLGGDVEDLAFFLTAMKEGGINASEGANALKSGLAALINPTEKASKMLADMGINIKAIVEGNQGDIQGTVIDFARALDTLDPLNRARAIEQLFGKFQFSRLSTLFQNVIKDGTQASKVLGLTTNSVEQLAIMSERELGVLEDAVGTKFKKAIEDLKLTLEPIGKTFLEAVTPIAQSIAGLLDKFNNLGDGTKKFIVIATTLVGIIGPVLLMTFGLLLNAVANGIKLFAVMRTGFLRLGGNSKILAEQTNYLSAEQFEAATVAASLNQAHSRLTQQFNIEASAVRALRQAYIDATVAAANFARTNPGMMIPGRGGAPKKFARGTASVPGKGRKDNVPAVLMPGEAVIPTDIAQDPQFQPIIDAMLSGKLQAFGTGTGDAQPFANSPQFKPKMDLSGPSSQVLNTNPGQVNNLLLGRSAFTETNEAFAARSAALLEKMNAKKTQAAQNLVFGHAVDRRQVSGEKVSEQFRRLGFGRENIYTSVGFDIPKEMNAQLNRKNSTVLAGDYRRALLDDNSLRTMTQNLIKRGIPDKEAFKVSKQIRTNLLKSLGSLPDNALVNDKMIYSRMGNEKTGIMGALAKSGDPVISRAAASLLGGVSSSAVGGSSIVTNKLKPIDDVIKAVQKTRSNPVLVKKLIELKKLNPNLQVPTRLNDAGEIVAYRRPEITGGKVTKNNVINALVDGKFKSQREFLGGGRQVLRVTKSLNDAFDRLTGKQPQRETVAVRARGEYKVDSRGNLTPLTGQNTSRKPSSVGTTSRNVSDNRTTTLGPNETIVQRMRRLRGFANAPQVDPRTGSTTLGEISQSSRLSRAQLLAATEKISLNEAKKRIAAESKLTSAMNESTEAQKTTKQKLSDFSSKASLGIGAISGLTIAASFAGGKLGETAQTLMPFVFGLQGIVALLPLLANPFVAMIAGIALVGGILFKMAKDIEKARQEGVVLANAMSMTSKKLVDLSVISGTVSASEEAARKRQNIVSGTVEGQRQFGQNVLDSEFGKQILADIETQSKSGKSIKEISENLANNLAVAVAQGAVTTTQARSIAAALGESLGSYEIPALVTGKLVSLIGPNGENLASDPLQVTLQIQKDSMQRQSDSFKTAIEGAISETTAPNVLARVAGFGLIATGIAATVLTGGVAAGAGIAAAGAGAMMLGEADSNKRKAVNVKLAAAAVELGIQEVAQNQGLVDSLNKQYDIKLKSAKTEEQIKAIEDERKNALDQINASNANALNLLVSQRDQLGEEAFTKGIKAAADVMYKEGPMAVFKDQAIEALSELEKSDFKTRLEIGLASGQVGPAVITKILSTAAGNKGFETSFNLLVDKQGLADAALIAQLLPSEGATDTTRSLMLRYVNSNAEDFDKDLQALSFLNQINPTYGITLDLKANGIQQIITTTNALKQIETLPDVLTKDVVAKLAEEKPGEWKAFYDQWTILSEGKDTVSKNLKVAFDVVSNDPNFKGFGSAAGKSAAELIAKGGTLLGPVPGGDVVDDGTAGKNRDTTLDELLKRLKFIRKASIDAQGGVKELLKITSGQGLQKFGGVMQQLMAGAKGGASREFISFLESLDNKTRKTYMNIKNGEVVLTKQGKALKEAFNEKVVGEFQVTQAQTIQDTLAQRAALLRLKAAGVDNATALEMVADASLAVAINSKSISSKELVKMGKDAKKAKDEIKDLNLEVQNLGASVQDKITNLNTIITALSAARASGITSEELLDYIASNQELADQIASKGINDPIVQDLIKNQPKIEDLEDAIAGLKNPLAKIQSDFDKAREKAERFYNFLENQANNTYKKWLQNTKVTFEGVSYSIETALEKAKDKVEEYQESIDDASRNVELEFDRPMEAMREQIDDIQRDIELQFDRPIDGLQREINGLQRQIEEQFDRPIQALQDESGRLANDLSILSRVADEINKKYDAQEEALNKISELNQDIISQEKQRIGLADAITRGDISAAAQAAQDMRAATAASAVERAGGALGQAREAELAGLRTAGGLTKVQAEERQFQISQQTYQLEQNRDIVQAQILAKQDVIYRLEQARVPLLDKIRGIEDQIYILQERKEDELLKIRVLEDEIYKINEEIIEPINRQLDARQKILQAEIDAIEAQREKWEETQTGIDAAKIKADGFDTTMAGIESKTAAMLKNWNDIQSKVVTLTTIQQTISAGSSSGSTVTGTRVVDGRTVVTGLSSSASGSTVGGKFIPMNYGGVVPKYMAAGGRIGSDSVPAMLTPGEFVMNRRASEQFGPMLSMLNESKYPSMIGNSIGSQTPVNNISKSVSDNSTAVYNYNLGFNINGSNANAKDIANVVMREIKNVDLQRVRGQRV